MEALGQLGTLYRFGTGVAQDLVRAAELHVVAALEGDVTSIANLNDYIDEITQAAETGDSLACLCMAKIHERGLVGKRSQSGAYAWLVRARSFDTPEVDPDVRLEINDLAAFLEMMLPYQNGQPAPLLTAWVPRIGQKSSI